MADVQISNLTEQTTLLDTDNFVLEDTVANLTKSTLLSTIKSTLKTYFDTLYSNEEPIGTVKEWDKNFPSTPALSEKYVECDGSLIDDSESVFDGYRSRNLNGADVVLTQTWTADGGGAYTTVSSANITALAVGDDVTGSGIAANSYISDITGTTVTITDVSASGSISSTFTNDGRFLRGGSASGTGQKDIFQGHGFLLYAGPSDNATTTPPYIGTSGGNSADKTTTADHNAGFMTDGFNGVPRTGTETRPVNTNIVYIMRIK